MEAVGLAVGLLATADLCLKYGRELTAVCFSFQNAEIEVTELFLALKTLWLRIQRQILVLCNVEVANSLGEELQYLQMQMLGILQSRLRELTAKIGKLSNASLLRRKITYAVWMKESLRDSIKDLEVWYQRWDPSWFLIARLAVPGVDLAIHNQSAKEDTLERQPLTILKGLRTARHTIESASSSSIEFLPASITFSVSAQVRYSTVSKAICLDTNEALLIDTIPYRENTNETAFQNDVQKLVQILSTMDARICNVLMCTGAQKITNSNGQLQGYTVLFRPPITQRSQKSDHVQGFESFDERLSIRSLRDVLLDGTHTTSLTYRMRVARDVARSIIFLHSASFVHKSIRPETIITTKAGASYLVGFQWFRAASGDTHMLGDAVQSKDLYRHPTRQGEAPEEMYSMQHDVYSLGVCLLEIGLWTSFVTYNDDPAKTTVSVPSVPEAAIQLAPRGRKQRSYEVKRKMTDLAKRELPSRMGERYSALVVSCLTCLDKDSDLGNVDALLEDDNGVVLGVRS